MKRQNSVRRNGAVLLMILGLMAMFAISILTYMVVTSNMAETAQNSAKLDATLEIPAQEDVEAALKTVVIGSNNERNPIGPFSILENMYGDWKEYDGDSEDSTTQFLANICIFPNLGIATVSPVNDIYGNELRGMSDADARAAMMSLFENSGGVLTFKTYQDMPNEDAENYWASDVENTSAFVLEKVVTNPTNFFYKDGTAGAYWNEHYNDGIVSFDDSSNFSPCDAWHFKVELTDDLRRFVDDLSSNINTDFNEAQPQVFVRLNRPAYSGTGAGGFTPGEAKDATIPYELATNNAVINTCGYMGQEPNGFRIPFAFWANAAAPDLRPFRMTNGSKMDFRAYWAQLADVNYDANLLDANGGGAGGLRYSYEPNGGFWQMGSAVTSGYQDDSYLEPVRMNPAYTAPDNRTMFLAHFGGPMTIDGELPEITPSFHRPSVFNTLNGGFLGAYYGVYQAAGKNNSACEQLLSTLIRKLTPRPLPLDHWNFDGGNTFLSFQNLPTNDSSDPFAAQADLVSRFTGYYDFDGSGTVATQWDVDNDGDGVREGIWLPSGFPIRVDKNGTPYATMVSYTVIDLDGRVNVNTAGNWDQLPNKINSLSRTDNDGGNYNDYSQPFNYVDELTDVASGITSTPDGPFYDVRVLRRSGDMNWLDDSNMPIDVVVRGDGRGASNVQLYEALSKIFESYSAYDINTVASNLLWRRNLNLKSDPLGKVDQTNLNWDNDNKMGAQPGDFSNGEEADDTLNTRQNFFALMDPVRLQLTSLESSNGTFSGGADNVTSLGEAKMRYPYRGKMTVDMNNVVSAAVYDFANTAFRSYDPLGAQIYTYAPRYSNNPYLAYQNVLTWQDSPYTLPMLERLLRPWDSDANALPTQLVDDIWMNTDLNSDAALERERAAARQSLTTISSDVPAPSLVFPENVELEDGEFRGGHFGFADLVRNCVRQELYKVFEAKEIFPKINDVDAEGNPIEIDVTADNLSGNVVFNNKVEEITAYLVSMLPPEIMAGEKIDLNALSQKNYWLDLDYDNNGNPVDSIDYNGDRDIHNVGLVKRMERARGLYLVMMTLLYEDMNANKLFGVEEGDAEERAKKLDGYIEGSFDLLTFDDGDKKKAKGLMAQELTATRIAQWCVNTIDFSDPDATMTPFFFDPTPFDGWWVYDNSWIEDGVVADAEGNPVGWNPGTEPAVHFLFASEFGLPSEQMNKFFKDALEKSEEANGANSTVYQCPDWVTDAVNEDGTVNDLRSNAYIAKWMSKKIEKLEDQSSDLGFRLVWGMERPDLLLTETLSFHDLGIADTEYEQDSLYGESYVQDGFNDSGAGDDPDFDQVKRPVGSTYLELYCTANPNVPQSRELYDYDETDGVWKLRLSEKTPVFVDKLGRQLEMPIWRVAIGASSDPSGVNDATESSSDSDETKEDKKELRKSSTVVYNKRRNSVLEWLTPKKSSGDYMDDINFFSMQTRQFRNYPTNTQGTDDTALEVKNIADLDIDQGLDGDGADAKVKEPNVANFLDDWKQFNLSSSNVLGPAVAAKYGKINEKNMDQNPRTREIELDRIVWFTHALGDSNNGGNLKLGTAGEYPDALRTFSNESNENVYLEPNQYLVVGPDKKRKIGSQAYNATIPAGGDTNSGHFDVDPASTSAQNWIDIDNSGTSLGLGNANFSRNYKYMVAKANIGGRGLNISEPLWTAAGVDPYKTINPADAVGSEGVVMDVPFELPGEWSEGGSKDKRRDVDDEFYKNNVKNYPIVQDKLFGLGTVPAYKSAFVQRVADPNRPYHPLMNPYITVDWNVMDLTVFTGEGRQLSSVENETKDYRFSVTDGYRNAHSGANEIKLAENKALNLEKDKTLKFEDAFSSRQWGNASQKTFAPMLEASYSPAKRPNPWARAFRGEGNKAGLQSGEALSDVGLSGYSVVPFVPKHTLGMYNNAGKWGQWVAEVNASGESVMTWHDADAGNPGNAFKGLNSEFLNKSVLSDNLKVYAGAPRVPFEHLVWNDAPYSNPMELALVPASAPGRFGLEFVRNESEFKLSKLYKVDSNKGGALGSFGVFGFKEWYNDDNIKVTSGTGHEDDQKLKGLKDKAGRMGPYLNFFSSSKKAGETLNLCKALEFVYVPSLFLGTKKLAGRDDNGDIIADENGNPIFHSKRREPGKINLNTVTGPAWHALSPNSERIQVENRLPGTTWDELLNSRYPYETKLGADDDGDGNPDPYTDDNKPFCYFQPSHTLGLWVQMDGSKAPVPTYTSILAQRDCDLNDKNSVEEDPIFDNISPDTDGGETNYHYSYLADPDDPTSKVEGFGTMSVIESLQSAHPNLEYDEVKLPRNNLFEATAEMQRLSGVTTTRSNAFAVWVTVGYFEVERCAPGVNMPKYDPDGNELTVARLTDADYKWYQYYQAIYPDGYTYGKELGSEFGETQRHRGFSIIDRSIPVDYRRGNSANYKKAILSHRVID